MQYLDPSEYVSFGLSTETSDDLVTAASAMIDSFCKRPSLGVTQFVERVRFSRHNQAQLSYTPLVAAATSTTPLVSISVRMRHECANRSAPLLLEQAIFFAGNQWVVQDIASFNVTGSGVLQMQASVLGNLPAEAEVTYTAGYAEVPVPVKVACAQIVRNAQATPALTVRRQAIDSLQLEYFSGTLLDADVMRLLQPYVSERVG